jgi:hypothetical protein
MPIARAVNSRWLVLASWAFTRVVIALMGLQHLPYVDNEILYNDLDVYSRWTREISTGIFPSADPMWQYPPFAGAVFVASRLFGEGRTAFVLLSLVVDFLILLVLLADGRRRERLQGAWLWVGTALLVGPLLLGRFDLMPTLFAVLAVVWAGRPVRSGVASAIGAMLKVWPALTLLALPRRSLSKAVAAFVVTGIVAMTMVIGWTGGGLSFLGNQRDRGIQEESVAALPFLVARMFGAPVQYVYRYGAMEVEATGAALAGVIASVVGLVLIAVVAWWRLRGRLEDVAPADVAFTVVLISVATSRVFSPQYDVWLLGLGALCLADRRSRLPRAVALVAVASLVAQLVFPWMYAPLNSGGAQATVLQALRIALIVGAAALAVVKISPRRPDESDGLDTSDTVDLTATGEEDQELAKARN